MSATLAPERPQQRPERLPKSVYIRRRILVLLGFLAVIAAVVLILWRPGSQGSTEVDKQVTVPEDVVVANEPAADSGITPGCAPSQLLVVPITDQNEYAADAQPKLALSIENTAAKPCVADLGTAGMTFTITSGSDEVWRSVDCQTAPDHRQVILEAGTPLTTEWVTWDRTRSDVKSCDAKRDPVVAGGASYHLTVSAAGVEALDSVQFLLY